MLKLIVELAVTTPLPLSNSALKDTGVKNIESCVNVGVPNKPDKALSQIKSKLLPTKVTEAAVAFDEITYKQTDAIALNADNIEIYYISLGFK